MRISSALRLVAVALGLSALVAGPRARAAVPAAAGTISGYTVVHAYPHDPEAFTQGLEYAGGFFYEGTGLTGRSSIRKVKVETGEVLQQRAIDPKYFGEGITLWKNELVQLTWRSQVAFVYDRLTFAPKRQFAYMGEGWGLTHDATSLIMSDGSATIRFLDPATFAERRRITVVDSGLRIANLNELEYIDGEIFANLWQTDFIARIAPATGVVAGWIDLRGLLPEALRAGHQVDVLNGIAWDAQRRRLFVTGKLWPKVFEIKLK